MPVTRSDGDVLIVGAGIVGAAVAAALAERGRRVLVLESGFAGGGTTAAGMGHLVAMDDSPAQLALTRYSLQLWQRLMTRTNGAAEYDRAGTLWIAESSDQLAACRAKQRVLAGAGLDTVLLDSRELAEAEPHLAPGLAGALLVRDDAILYPPAAARLLLDAARAAGARVLEHAPVRALVAGGVRTERDAFHAPIVVIAAGAESPRLIPSLPVLPRKGHLVITDRHPGLCRHQLVELGYLASAHQMTSESIAFNLQPRSTGQVLIGSSRELVGWERETNPGLVHRMLARAVGMLPALARASVIRTWTGFRPATPDKLPLIGCWEPGTWVAAGHEGLGITTALATAEILADLLDQKAPAIDASPFDPRRSVTAEPDSRSA